MADNSHQQHLTPSATPFAHPDLIASGQLETSEVLFKMTRHHASALGAYLNQRSDIAQGQLPKPVQEILAALTVRLVSPPGARWNSLRNILDGQPARVELDSWAADPIAYEGRRRRPYDGGPNGEDLRDSQVELIASEADFRLPPSARNFEALLGDADGTTMAEWPEKWKS